MNIQKMALPSILITNCCSKGITSQPLSNQSVICNILEDFPIKCPLLAFIPCMCIRTEGLMASQLRVIIVFQGL